MPRGRVLPRRFSMRSEACGPTSISICMSTSTTSARGGCSTWRRSSSKRPRKRICIAVVPRRCWRRSRPPRPTGPTARVHVEYFQAREAPALEGGFEVRLARSNRTDRSGSGQNHFGVAARCRHLSPTTPAAKVSAAPARRACIEGTPDHRDLFLSEEEQAANKTIMICCSGSRIAHARSGPLAECNNNQGMKRMRSVSRIVGVPDDRCRVFAGAGGFCSRS